MKVKSEGEVAQSCLTLSHPMDCSPPGSSIHGIVQAGVLEWGAIAFSANPREMKVINVMLMRGDLRMKIAGREDNPFILEHGRWLFR